MTLSDRQRDILQKAVFEYIDRAEPVSSGWLERQYDMPFSPATIRAEMLQLTEGGYLEQPHTSSGRVPTDKGYRFFVDELRPVELEDEQPFGFSALALAYYHRTLWKENWERVLQEPEFSRAELLGNFTKFVSDIEQNSNRIRRVRQLEVYIGKENPFSSVGDFSMILSECDFAQGPRYQSKHGTGRAAGFVAIVGPKRMPYQKNIGFIHSLIQTWKKKLKR